MRNADSAMPAENRADAFSQQQHTVIMEDRRLLRITGITDIDSFDEREIVVYTKAGELTITGRDLHINAISIESGNMSVEGDIWSLQYGDKDKQSPVSLLGKLFR